MYPLLAQQFVLDSIGLQPVQNLKKYVTEADIEEANTVQKWVVPIGIICLLLCILIPSEEVCYRMLIASYVTPENINATIDGSENLAKRALELITDSVIKIIKEVN